MINKQNLTDLLSAVKAIAHNTAILSNLYDIHEGNDQDQLNHILEGNPFNASLDELQLDKWIERVEYRINPLVEEIEGLEGYTCPVCKSEDLLLGDSFIAPDHTRTQMLKCDSCLSTFPNTYA